MIKGTSFVMTDRAARRLCDRLVELGVVRELTGARGVPVIRGVSMPKETPSLDTELEDLPPDLRWREWMGRIEAVIFASASPVLRADLSRVVGQGASVDLLIEDIQTELVSRPYELVAVADGWLMRTRVRFADVIRTAADVSEQLVDLDEFEVAVLASIVYH